MTSLITKEIEIRQRLKDNLQHFSTRCMTISTKSGDLKKLVFNNAQQYLHAQLEKQLKETGKVRAIIVKGRQQGVSTYVADRFYHKAIHRKGLKVFILTHKQEATDNLFAMAQRFWEHSPPIIKPRIGSSNAKEFSFVDLGSGYKVGTAGNKGVGRSSTIQLFHGSEVAFWPHSEEHAKGVLQAIADEPGTEIILESTGNGLGNYFHQMWVAAEKGENDFMPVFIPWFWEPEYQSKIEGDFEITDEEIELRDLYGLSNEQLLWRRKKISQLPDKIRGFRQEYPNTPVEAFQSSNEESYIQNELVLAARKCGEAESFGPKILGVDPAYKGKDKTALILRQGRVASNLILYAKLDTMQVVGKIIQFLTKHNPQFICVDVIGIGAGVVDRLRELGYSDKVKAINSGATAYDDKRYTNLKAEMWGEMKGWLEDYPVKLPDVDLLHTDLCAPSYFHDSKNRLAIERKKDMKSRGFASTDSADALALTFGFPFSKNTVNISQLLTPSFRL